MWCTFLRQMLVEVPNSLPLISRSDVCYILISLFWQCRHLVPRCSEAAWDKSRICCWQTSALHVNRKDCFAFIVGGNTTLSRIRIFLSKKKKKTSFQPDFSEENDGIKTTHVLPVPLARHRCRENYTPLVGKTEHLHASCMPRTERTLALDLRLQRTPHTHGLLCWLASKSQLINEGCV